MGIVLQSDQIIDFIHEAIIKAFNVQFSIPVSVTGTRRESQKRSLESFDLGATIELKSSNARATIAILFPMDTYLNILEKIHDQPFEELNQENSDGAGEILNIIYCTFRPRFNSKGYGFEPAIPKVMPLDAIYVPHIPNSTITTFTCECEYGPFNVEFSQKIENAA